MLEASCYSSLPESLNGRRRQYSQMLQIISGVGFLVSSCSSLSLHGTMNRAAPWTTKLRVRRTDGLSSRFAGTECLSQKYSSLEASTFVTSKSLLQWEDYADAEDLRKRRDDDGRTFAAYGFRRKSTHLVMGKGDGKKKRKKKSASAPAPTPVPETPAPRRVTNNSLMSVKTQIRLVKLHKAAGKTQTSFRQSNMKRTKYRRSWDEEEIEEKRVERSQRGKEPDWDVILNRTASSPLVMIDGYNVIHKWPRLKKWMKKGQLSRARDTLVFDLEQLRLIKGWRIECVFDGAGKSSSPGPLGPGPGSSEVSSRITGLQAQSKKKVTNHGVRVVYSGAGDSADSYISQRCFHAKNVTRGEMTGSLIVASDDNMIRVAGANAGALCMSSGHLVDELKAVRQAIMHRVEVAVAEANGHGVRPAALHGTTSPGRFANKMVINDKRKKGKDKNMDGEET
uniref:Uncharacterized protein n=1 Tax=Odontella aurita TaxID=265563 RepID=A0A7S4MBD6_9STRA|mmetsp:Transcript_17066/g.49277  ORF Transcript_17066/g.49277 Transcript_17066/m.49277 type:complete len:452 (+) Transcript_17066:355-1710(+)